MKTSNGEALGTIAVILFALSVVAISCGVTFGLYYALFHFIIKFW